MKENLIHYRTCVCNINYHMVWSVKYRRKILNQEIEEYLQEMVQQIAENKGFTVHLFERRSQSDCVHEKVAKRIANVRYTVGKVIMSTVLYQHHLSCP